MKKLVMIAGLLLATSCMAGVARTQQPPKSLDLNTATASQLASLKGIGAKKAAAIVSYRDKNGHFKSIADLSQVHGIGPKMLSRIENENQGVMKIMK